MTENQQKIIDNLIAEFNKRNEQQTSNTFNLIDLSEYDARHQRHLMLTEDAFMSKEIWEGNRLEYIYELIEKLQSDLGDRLVVKRGDDATDNPNLYDQIYIYKHGTPDCFLWERALRFTIQLFCETKRDEITKEHYDYYKGFVITRYIDGNYTKRYENEVEFFNCNHTKNKLNELLN